MFTKYASFDHMSATPDHPAAAARFGDSLIAEAAGKNGISAASFATAHCQGSDGGTSVCLETDGRQFMAVDRFGIRSLCFRVIDGKLHVAKRADDLAQLGPVAEIDLQALFDYLYFHVIPAPRTVFKGVNRLPAGHCATFSNSRLQVERYWTPEFRDIGRSFHTAADQFRRLVKAGVASELDGRRPACFLSGGTDSSTVAGMIAAVAGRSHSYSIGFDADGYDEMQYARIAARHFGTDHHEYYVTPDDVVASLPSIAEHYDQPFGNSSALPAYYCARLAREDGVTRLLAGDGGDELFGGNARYAKQKVFEWYQRIPPALRRVILEPVFLESAIGSAPIARKVARYVEQARVPLPSRMQTYNLLTRLGPTSVLTRDFLARVDAEDVVRQQEAAWIEPMASNYIDRILSFDWRYTLAESDLPKVTGASELAGIAVGYPLLSRELVDFSMTLPAAYKVRGLRLRWFFKEALRDFLPTEILHKRKQGFGLPFGPWTQRNAALHGLIVDALGSLAARNIVQPAFLKRLLNDLLPSHPGYFGELVWVLTVLELWIRKNRSDFSVAA